MIEHRHETDTKWTQLLSWIHLIDIHQNLVLKWAKIVEGRIWLVTAVTTLHQPVVHRNIKQVNPDTFWQTFDSSLLVLLGVISMFSMLFCGREQVVRDLGLNRITLICIFWCHFSEVSMILVAGIKLHRISQTRNFRWNPAEHTIASIAKKQASPADVTSAS